MIIKFIAEVAKFNTTYFVYSF